MDYWEGPARWINTILLVIVAFIGFDTLFRLLNANEENVIVGFVMAVAGFFLSPFEGMFPDQEFLLTAIIAVLGYSLLAGVALAVTRSIQASRRARVRRQQEAQITAGPAAQRRRDPGSTQPLDAAGDDTVPPEADRTRPVGSPPVEGGTRRDDAADRDATRPVRRPREGSQDTPQQTSPRGGGSEDATERTPTTGGRRSGNTGRTQRLS